MYYIERGMGKKWKPLAIFFAVTIILGGLGTAAFAQPYTMSTALERTFHIPAWVVTVAAAAICGIVLIGGVKGIGKFCEKITPAMCLIYVVGALGVIIVNIRFVPQAFAAIFKYAFAPMPAIGGLAGSTLALALRQGAARGTFSNEAGCGSSPIPHATAITDHPFKEGMYGSFEVFVDTIIVCTMTSLAIMCSGSDIWASGVKAEALTMSAFDAAYGTTIGNLLVTIPLALFAFSTMVGWEINYESAFFYIFPKMETSKIFKVLIRVLWLVPGFIALGNTPDLVWTVVDIASGLWCVPNAIALIALSGGDRTADERFGYVQIDIVRDHVAVIPADEGGVALKRLRHGHGELIPADGVGPFRAQQRQLQRLHAVGLADEAGDRVQNRERPRAGKARRVAQHEHRAVAVGLLLRVVAGDGGLLRARDEREAQLRLRAVDLHGEGLRDLARAAAGQRAVGFHIGNGGLRRDHRRTERQKAGQQKQQPFHVITSAQGNPAHPAAGEIPVSFF